MELLAPVGSKESFITALRAGADAVYIGVPDFNARVAAANINFYDLEVLIDAAHTKNKKVYLALNTLVKHEEINEAVKRINHISKLSPDAIIVQDLGIASIIKNYFPDLVLHASTQMAVHNSLGVEFLARNGFKRAILARELSFSELKNITGSSRIGIEIFCHGALCFSLSGMCLFSSYIGGLSGNRGRCTQPCRRLWQNGKNQGYIFSPRDLELAEHINKLKKAGIESLKIEGRMRSSEYVYRVVKAYRMLIDAPESDFDNVLKEAKIILAQDMAREKTTCLFAGRDGAIFQPKKAQCLGNYIGAISSVFDGKLTIELTSSNENLKEGDRLRLSNPVTDTTVAFKLKEFLKEDSKYTIDFSRAGEFVCGNPVFKTVDSEYDQKDIEKEIDLVYVNFKSSRHRGERFEMLPSQTYTALISGKWKEVKKLVRLTDEEDMLWVRFENPAWLDILPKPENSRYVFYLTKENLHYTGRIPADIAQNLAGELPPFVGQRDIPHFKQAVTKMAAMGIKKWVLNNVSHFGLFDHLICELIAGHFLYTWNAYSAAFYSDNGVKYFTASWEDDFLNIRKMCGPGLGKYVLVYLYGYPPITRSRMITKEMLEETKVKDFTAGTSKQEERTYSCFRPVFESELAVLIPEAPVNNFTAKRKLLECGISNFGIDLSFLPPDKKNWNTIYEHYKTNENIQGTPKFNFKRCIK